MKNLLVLGAGAIGRGYLPWVFDEPDVTLTFCDNNDDLLADLIALGSYPTYMTAGGQYLRKVVTVNEVFHIDRITDDQLKKFDFIITCVGPRAFLGLTDFFKRVTAPIVCFENDRQVVQTMRMLLGREDVYFGVPDVITSNSASLQLLEESPLALITENGQTYCEAAAAGMGGKIHYVSDEEMHRQWMAKLYIHNTPHCIAAYLGSMLNLAFLHEVLACDAARLIVEGATEEMALMVQNAFGVDSEFTQFYASKELQRFANTLLFDPISRVAREPFRKLEPDGRLVGAARRAFMEGIEPKNVLVGIYGAFSYRNRNDQDAIIEDLFDTLSPEKFLAIGLRLDQRDIVSKALLANWNRLSSEIERVLNNV